MELRDPLPLLIKTWTLMRSTMTNFQKMRLLKTRITGMKTLRRKKMTPRNLERT
jgi:hypothetical protein